MFTGTVQRQPNNAHEFQAMRQNVVSLCSIHAFEEGLKKLNPTPAQALQLLEIVLLSGLPRDIKYEFMQKLGEQSAFTVHNISFRRGDEAVTGMLVEAYKDAANITAFCQDQLEPILANTAGSNGLSAEEINSYLFAKLQDRLRFMLRVKYLPVEDRSEYTDPAPQTLGRTREDFLDGKGTFDPAEEGF
jgi:hypothetical protein